MPATTRRTRRRLITKARPPLDSARLMRLAKIATKKHWDNGLRKDVIQMAISSGNKLEQAVKIAGAFERRPELIAGAPPCDKDMIAELQAELETRYRG